MLLKEKKIGREKVFLFLHSFLYEKLYLNYLHMNTKMISTCLYSDR